MSWATLSRHMIRGRLVRNARAFMRALNLDHLRVAPPLSPSIVGFATAIVLAQIAALFGALLVQPVLWAAASVVGIVLDVVGHRVPRIRGMFGNAQVGLVARALVRELGLVILVMQLAPDESLVLAVAASIPLARGALLFLSTPEKALLRPAMQVRNLDFPLVHRRWLPAATAPDLVTATLALVPVALLGLLSATWWPFISLAGGLSLVLLIWALWLAVSAVRHTQQPLGSEYARQASEALHRHAPELVLYFSGTIDSVYQVNMWLRVVEKIGRPAVVVLRNDLTYDGLAPTPLPVVSIPSAVALMNFRMPTVRVSFVVAHVGNNIHILREPRMKHVFIGHGEVRQDGFGQPHHQGVRRGLGRRPASRRRWHQARVGIRDDAIVEVGRPQLGHIRPPERGATDRPLSVLYAPTWEGWITGAAMASSVAHLGVDIVNWLLSRPGTRVIYKPHPLTGTVSGRSRTANLEMMRLLRAGSSALELPAGASEADWIASGNDNLVVEAAGPSLYDCFNHADVLIGDVSSVVPDFLASGKPYLIPNPQGLAHDAIRTELASTRAAYIMDPDRTTWEALLTEATGADPSAAAPRSA